MQALVGILAMIFLGALYLTMIIFVFTIAMTIVPYAMLAFIGFTIYFVLVKP